MSRSRVRAASYVWMGLVVAGFFLAACGAGPPGRGSNTSGMTEAARDTAGTTEAARDTANTTTEEVTTSWLSDTGVVFIRQKPAGGRRDVMEARAAGKVVVDDAGCIRLEYDRPYGGNLIVWPPGYSMRTERGEVLIIKKDGETFARVGNRVEFGGGQITSASGGREAYAKHLEIPEKCTGPLWIVGEVGGTIR